MVPLHGLRPRKILPETKVRWVDDGEENSAESDVTSISEDSVYVQELEVPIFTVQEDEKGRNKNPFKLPKTYIKYQEIYNIPEFELDDDDENFLAQLPKNPAAKKKFKEFLNEDVLETAIDFFEKESFANKEYSLLIPIVKGESELLSVCSVCSKSERVLPEGEHAESSLMECSGCGILSHASCQGLKKFNPQWTCKRCQVEKKKSYKKVSEMKQKCKALAQNTFCTICHKAEGSMVSVEGGWAHNVCIAWQPGFSFKKEESHIKQICKNRCVVCREKDNLIRCSENSCNIHYHGSCAQVSRFYLDSNYPEGKPISFCYTHSLKVEKQILEKLLPEGKATVAIGRFLTQSTRAELNKKIAPLHKELPEDIFNIIWEYWKKKRLSVDYGRTPLIPRLVIEKDRVHTLSAKNEQFRLSQAQLRWEYHKAQMEAYPLPDDQLYLNLLNIRNHVERLRVLLDLVKKREKMKLLQTSLLTRQLALCTGQEIETPLSPTPVRKHHNQYTKPRAVETPVIRRTATPITPSSDYKLRVRKDPLKTPPPKRKAAIATRYRNEMQQLQEEQDDDEEEDDDNDDDMEEIDDEDDDEEEEEEEDNNEEIIGQEEQEDDEENEDENENEEEKQGDDEDVEEDAEEDAEEDEIEKNSKQITADDIAKLNRIKRAHIRTKDKEEQLRKWRLEHNLSEADQKKIKMNNYKQFNIRNNNVNNKTTNNNNNRNHTTTNNNSNNNTKVLSIAPSKNIISPKRKTTSTKIVSSPINVKKRNQEAAGINNNNNANNNDNNNKKVKQQEYFPIFNMKRKI